MSEQTTVEAPAGDTTTEKEEVTLSKQEHKDLVEGLANRTQDTSNLTAEIKTLREDKRLAVEEAEKLKAAAEAPAATPAAPTELTAENVATLAAETVSKALQANEENTAKANKETALTRFKTTHKEFHEDNDEAGLKMSAFNRKLVRINMAGLKSETDFLEAFEDAFALMPKDKQPTVDPTIQQPTASEGGASIPEVEQTTLTSQEEKLVRESFDGDKERYLKIKTKRPDYVGKLLQHGHY